MPSPKLSILRHRDSSRDDGHMASSLCRYNQYLETNAARHEGNAMPVHNWTRVDAGIFHHFHHDWIAEFARVLNRGLLPLRITRWRNRSPVGGSPTSSR